MGELNARRISRVEAAMAELARESCGENFEDERDSWLVDFLTDLRHWAKAEGRDFNADLAMSEIHFEEEDSEDE